MKALFFVLIAIVSVSCFSACNRDFKCQCTFTDTSKNFEIKIEKVRKNDAKVLCDDYSEFVGNCTVK